MADRTNYCTGCVERQRELDALRAALARVQEERDDALTNVEAEKLRVAALQESVDNAAKRMLVVAGQRDTERAAAQGLQVELDALRSWSPSPCGHSSEWAYTEDGGKHVVCLLCERASAQGMRAALEHCKRIADERVEQGTIEFALTGILAIATNALLATPPSAAGASDAEVDAWIEKLSTLYALKRADARAFVRAGTPPAGPALGDIGEQEK